MKETGWELRRERRAPLGWWLGLLIAVLGVLLPAAALVTEMLSGMCRNCLFDPLPTPVHVVLVALVPVTHFLYLLGYRKRFLTGMTLGVCLLYCLPFFPILPMAITAVVWWGLGLLPLAPYLGTATTIAVGIHQGAGRDTWRGFLVGCLVLLLATGFPHLESFLLERGDSTSIQVLRAIAPASSLKQRCTETRKTYYKVTGQSPTDRPAPVNQNLELRSSTVEGWVDSDAALAYLEWTFEAFNSGTRSEEGWLKLSLPPGGAVCRATLWVDGQPREAVFSSTGTARRAYNSVVAKNRDPLLVTAAGPDKAELRFFPITLGKPMKMRVGITVPLTMSTPEKARLAFPVCCDGNLRLPAESSIFLHAKHKLSVLNPGPGWRPEWETQSLCGHYSHASGPLLVEAERDAAVKAVSCRLLDGRWLCSRLEEEPRPERLAVVVDSSLSMQRHRKEVDLALRSLNPATVIVAGDLGPLTWQPGQFIDFAGGRDNLPALRRACEQADSVVWLRGPQEELLSEPGAFQVWLESAHKRIYDLPLEPQASDAAMERLRLPGLRPWPRTGNFDSDLRQLAQPHFVWRQQVTKERPEATGTSDHLARLWVMESCDHLNLPESVQLAAQYRLITRWSAAVVLETDADYASRGLKSGDSLSRQEEEREGAPAPLTNVPPGLFRASSAPEPETAVLALLVVAGLARRRRKRS